MSSSVVLYGHPPSFEFLCHESNLSLTPDEKYYHSLYLFVPVLRGCLVRLRMLDHDQQLSYQEKAILSEVYRPVLSLVLSQHPADSYHPLRGRTCEGNIFPWVGNHSNLCRSSDSDYHVQPSTRYEQQFPFPFDEERGHDERQEQVSCY